LVAAPADVVLLVVAPADVVQLPAVAPADVVLLVVAPADVVQLAGPGDWARLAALAVHYKDCHRARADSRSRLGALPIPPTEAPSVSARLIGGAKEAC
jgi:hypothetical protein